MIMGKNVLIKTIETATVTIKEFLWFFNGERPLSPL